MFNLVNMARGKFTNLEKEQIGKRILDLATRYNVKAAKIAKYCGVTRATAGNWMQGSAVPDIGNAERLAKMFRVHYRYIIYGEESVINEVREPELDMEETIGVSDWDSSTPLSEEEVEIPLFIELEIAAGVGNFAEYEHDGPVVRFAKSSLRKAGVPPECAFFATVRGDSMLPKYEDGGVIGICTSATRIIDGKEYAIDHGGLARFKVLYRLPGGRVRIHSYNEVEYPDEIVDESEIRIVGQKFSYQELESVG